jgi:hypothetical protein
LNQANYSKLEPRVFFCSVFVFGKKKSFNLIKALAMDDSQVSGWASSCIDDSFGLSEIKIEKKIVLKAHHNIHNQQTNRSDSESLLIKRANVSEKCGGS